MVSDMPQEIPRRSKRHLATGGSGDTGAFNGESPIEGDGTVHTTPGLAKRLKDQLARERSEREAGTDQFAEESPPAQGPGSRRAKAYQDQLDAMAREKDRWQPQD
jgi:hypothetical protein